MFGCLAFILGGHMFCGVVKDSRRPQPSRAGLVR
jgi:hypothetical protein